MTQSRESPSGKPHVIAWCSNLASLLSGPPGSVSSVQAELENRACLSSDSAIAIPAPLSLSVRHSLSPACDILEFSGEGPDEDSRMPTLLMLDLKSPRIEVIDIWFTAQSPRILSDASGPWQ